MRIRVVGLTCLLDIRDMGLEIYKVGNYLGWNLCCVIGILIPGISSVSEN